MTDRAGRLTGRTAIVTGAKLEADGVGIGGAIVRGLVAEGAVVAVVNRSIGPAVDLVRELNRARPRPVASAWPLDLTDSAAIEAVIPEVIVTLGGVDILINNAAVTGTRQRERDLLEVDVDVWDSIYALNVRAPFLMAKQVLPQLLAGDGGAIVNVSSTASLSGEFMRTAYGSSKAALNVLSQYIATQYGRHGVRCNAILPGLTSTANTRRNMPPTTWSVLERHVTRPAPNTAEDVANVAVFLCTDDGAGINGEIIRVDGGFLGHAPYAMDLRDLNARSITGD